MAHRAQRYREDAGERGAALITVLLFGTALLVLVGTLLSFSMGNLKAEHEQHDTKTLNLVLRTAIHSATYEINRDRLAGPYDPDGDGVGALGTGKGGAPDGIAVRGADPDGAGPGLGRLLGVYRTTVRDDGGLLIVTACAVIPRSAAAPFTDPRAVRSAEVLIEPQSFSLGGSEDALSIIGGNPDKAKVKVAKDSVVNVVGDADHFALNIANVDLFEAFVSAYETGSKVDDVEIKDKGDFVLDGMDPDSPGNTTTGADAVGNNAQTVITEDAVTALGNAITAHFQQTVDNAYASGPIALELAVGVATGEDAGDDSLHLHHGEDITLPHGVYEAKKLTMHDDVHLVGSGTLILSDEVSIKDNSSIQWDGAIIIANDDDVTKKGKLKLQDDAQLTGTGNVYSAGELELKKDSTFDWTGNLIISNSDKAKLKAEKDSVFSVDGVVAVNGNEKEAKVEIKKDASFTVDGALVLLSGFDDEDAGKEKGKLKIDKETSVTINGLFIMMGQEVKVDIQKDVNLNVTGSTVIYVAEDGDKKKTKFEFKVDKDGTINLIFDKSQFDSGAAALDVLLKLVDPEDIPLPIAQLGYWEVSGAPALAAQQARIDGGDPLGMPAP